MHRLDIARQEIRLLSREKTVMLLIIILLGLAFASTFIGWLSQHTIQQVYDVASAQLISEGKTAPPSPFTNFPDLSIVKNMLIYIVVCGALLAIALGHSAGVRDRKAGSVKMLFSHPINKKDFLLGKILAISFVLSLILLVAFAISAASSAVLVKLTWIDLLRLIGFYVFSFIYLMSFALLGLSFGLIMKNEAVALLIPIIIWLTITFVIPGFTSALYPTATLNPILPMTESHSPTLDLLHSIANPFSIAEHYKESGAYILNLKDSFSTDTSPNTNVLDISLVFLWLMICLTISFFVMHKFNPASEGLNE
jgi:ABC-2 type transport system permease protein